MEEKEKLHYPEWIDAIKEEMSAMTTLYYLYIALAKFNPVKMVGLCYFIISKSSLDSWYVDILSAMTTLYQINVVDPDLMRNVNIFF